MKAAARFISTRTGLTRSGIAGLTLLSLALTRTSNNGFANTAFIEPSDLVAFQGFGGAVAADGNVMAVGTQFAPFAVYVYANNCRRGSERGDGGG